MQSYDLLDELDSEDKFRKDISNAKTREGKLAVLNKYQGDRQQSFWDNKSKDLKGYVASGYAPTQTGAEKLLTTLQGKEREKYETAYFNDSTCLQRWKLYREVYQKYIGSELKRINTPFIFR